MSARVFILFFVPLLASCTDEQLQERAAAGTYEGRPAFNVRTEIDVLSKGIEQARDAQVAHKAERLCPGRGYKELSRSAPKRILRTHSYPVGAPPNQIWVNKSRTVSQSTVKIVCDATG